MSLTHSSHARNGRQDVSVEDLTVDDQPLARYSWSRAGAELVLHVQGEVDLSQEQAFGEAVDQLLAASQHPVVDLTGVFLDVRGLSVLLRTGEVLAPDGRCLLVEAPTPLTRRLLAGCAPHPGVVVATDGANPNEATSGDGS